MGAAGVVAFSVLSGVEGAIEPANAAQMATEVVQLAAKGDEVDPVEDPDAKADAPERVEVSTPSSFDNFWSTKAQTKTPAETKAADVAEATAAPVAAKDYLSELKGSNSLSSMDYDAITGKTDDYFPYRYDRGIDESRKVDLGDDDADRTPKGTKKRRPSEGAAASFKLPSFNAPSFNAPSFEAPSFEAPSFNVPSFDIPSFNIPAPAEPKAEPAPVVAVKAEPKEDDKAAEAKAEREAAAAAKKADAEAKAAAAKAEREAAAAAKKADAEAKAAAAKAEREAAAAAKKADAEAKAAAAKAEREAAAAAKKADAEAKAAAAKAEREAAAAAKKAAPAAADMDMGFDFGIDFSQYMESTPAAPKASKSDANAQKAAEKEAKKAAAEAKKAAEKAEREAAAAAKKAEAEAKKAATAVAKKAAPAAADMDMGFDFGIDFSQYMESTPTAPKAEKSADAAKKAAEKEAKKAADAAKKAEAEAKKAQAAAARQQAAAEAAAKKEAKKAELAAKKASRSVSAATAERTVYKKRTVEKKTVAPFSKVLPRTPGNPFGGALQPRVAAKEEKITGTTVDIDALLSSQEVKAEAILAKANDDSGDFLNISGEAAFGIAGTLALVYETENKKFEAERKAAMNATKSAAPTPTGKGGESTTEGWFTSFLAKYTKEGSASVPKPKPAPAKPKSDPVVNAKQAQGWINAWKKDAPKPAAAEAPKPAAAEAPKPAPAKPKSDPVANAKEAQQWIDSWKTTIKPAAPAPAPTPAPTPVAASTTSTTVEVTKKAFVSADNLTADQRAAAEAWIKKWREDGRPTDESKFGEAKVWLKEHNFES